jgi:hypothetical protein
MGLGFNPRAVLVGFVMDKVALGRFFFEYFSFPLSFISLPMFHSHQSWYWESTTGLKQAKGLKPGPSARRTKDLLKLNRDHLRWVVGLLTGHCYLKGHLFKLGLTDDPICERCLKEDESATHILCDCEAV